MKSFEDMYIEKLADEIVNLLICPIWKITTTILYLIVLYRVFFVL